MRPDAAGHVDVAVLGAGPAGAACALEAARAGLVVALFDPRFALPASTPTRFEKPCGEGLMPSGVRHLTDLGVDTTRIAGQPFGSISYLLPDAPPLSIALASAGLAVERPVLMQALHLRVESEAAIACVPARASSRRFGKGFLVESRDHPPLTATALVSAEGLEGASSSAKRSSGSRPARLGVRVRCQAREELEGVEVHAAPGCEVYLTPLAGAAINVAVLYERPPSDVCGAHELVELALARAPLARRRLGAMVCRPGARRLDRPFPTRVATDGAFLAGDAGGGVDPILGCGVSVALSTGVAAARAARALFEDVPPERVARSYTTAYRREVRGRRRLALALRGAFARPRLAAGMVELAYASPLARRVVDRLAAVAARPKTAPNP